MTIRMRISSRELVAAAEREIVTVSPEEAHQRAAAGEAVIVDVRDVRERRRRGAPAGALHMPRGMLEFWVDPESPYFKPVFAESLGFVFLCASGWRSALAARTLQDLGLEDVAHVAGGFDAWSKAGLPVDPPAPAGGD